MPKQKLKCVIYTRKSTEEGLEQDYNSLDAQRDAGEAYIKSQQHEGWELVGKHYDDGGFSGGNLNRPALQALLIDIQKGKVDVVVVYKVDRLSRSLSDFAKLVEIFDQNNVTFVSVTQAFNTTNSMGRLTLNILLSFAQFEREVTGERIRDKFASSLKKGMWMGGRLILGYDVKDRKLVVNEKEAAQVRSIFEGYLKYDSIYELLDELKGKRIRKKSWITKGGVAREGKYFDTSSIYSYLRNATYIGKVKHKGKVYEGEHEPIISDSLWEKVQAKLDDRKNVSGDGKNKIQPFILRGKLFDESGNSYQTTYTSKKAGEHKKFIRYYKVKKCTSAGYESNSLKSINADELEGVVSKILHQSFEGTPLQGLFLRLDEYSRRHALQGCIEKVVLLKDKLGITFNEDKKQALIDKYLEQGLSFNEETVEFEPFEMSRDGAICSVRIYPQKVSGKLVLGVGQNMIPTVYASHKHEQLIHALKTAHQCHALLKTGKAKGVMDLSRQLGKDRSYLSKVQKLYSLSPKIKAAILDGKQPEQTTVRSLLSLADSLDWKEQEELFTM